MNSILLVTAHLDDFEFGMGGTVSHLCQSNNVHLIVLCKGDRPGSEHVQHGRLQACISNCEDVGIDTFNVYQYSDTRLDTIPQTDICGIINDNILKTKCNIIYTHNISDVHSDHCVVSKATRVAARMRSTSPVDELYEFPIPGSTEWGSEPFAYNKYQDISEHTTIKYDMISRYNTELKASPDPLSIDMLKCRDQYLGSVCGYKYAETFKTIFNR